MGLYRTTGAAAESTLQFLMAAAFAASLGNPAGLFLAVIDRIWLASALNLGWGIIAVAVSWAMRDHGAPGVTFAFLVGYALHAVVAHWVVHRQIPRFMTS